VRNKGANAGSWRRGSSVAASCAAQQSNERHLA